MPAKSRVILDTNWYVSATINKNSRRKVYELLTNDSLNILYSLELLKEYNAVMRREKFRKLVKPENVARFLSLVTSQLEEINIKTLVQKSSDEKDNFLLSMSIDGKADYLITGDMVLLELKEVGKTKIITMAEFETIFLNKQKI